MDILKTLGIGLFLIGLVVLTVGPMFMMLEDKEVPLGISLGYWAMMLGMALLLIKAYQDRVVAAAEEAGDEDMQRKY
ncbi:MAG: hypothetical protein QGG50_03935 [Methanopyri archaeon]|jgi:hypothetical protein|nr:hypothetical protein [Methanopyri archaeon]